MSGGGSAPQIVEKGFGESYTYEGDPNAPAKGTPEAEQYKKDSTQQGAAKAVRDHALTEGQGFLGLDGFRGIEELNAATEKARHGDDADLRKMLGGGYDAYMAWYGDPAWKDKEKQVDDYKKAHPEVTTLTEDTRDPLSKGLAPVANWIGDAATNMHMAAIGKNINTISSGAAPWAAGAGGGSVGSQDTYTQSATPTVNTPFGSTSWTQDPTTGQWTQNQGLSTGLQGGVDSLQQQWADMLKKPMGDGSSARDQAIDAAYKQSTSRLDPQWDKRQQMMQAQLLNQGLDPSSEAGKNAMQELNFARNDAYSSAMNSAIGQGAQAGNTVFQNNLAAQNNPLQQLALAKQLGQPAQSPSLLNATIARENNARGLAAQAQQGQTDLINGIGQFASPIITGLMSG